MLSVYICTNTCACTCMLIQILVAAFACPYKFLCKCKYIPFASTFSSFPVPDVVYGPELCGFEPVTEQCVKKNVST